MIMLHEFMLKNHSICMKRVVAPQAYNINWQCIILHNIGALCTRIIITVITTNVLYPNVARNSVKQFYLVPCVRLFEITSRPSYTSVSCLCKSFPP